MPEELVLESNSARSRSAFAEEFFATETGDSDPQALIDRHEQLLIEQLGVYGLPVDDRTWSNFYDRGVAGSLGQDVVPAYVLERRVRESSKNILQALAWHYAPEFASWDTPRVILPARGKLVDNEHIDEISAIADRSWGHIPYGSYNHNYLSFLKHTPFVHDPADENAPYVLRVNLHYTGIQGWFDRVDSGVNQRGVKANYDYLTGLFNVGFEDGADFMGWLKHEDGSLVYALTYFHDFFKGFMADMRSDEKELISIRTWKAY